MKRVRQIEERGMIEALLARSAVYHALGVLLRHPSAQPEGWLSSREYRRWPEIVQLLRGEGAFATRLAQALKGAAIPAWTRQYEQIIGHSVQSAAPPYELEYGEPHSHRQPQELGDIAAFYQAFGLQNAPQAHERADHIATECEFMQFLLYKHAVALEDGHVEGAATCEQAARRFFQDHLGRWGAAFASRLSRAAGGGVLEVVAEALSDWLQQEGMRLGVGIGPREMPLRQWQEPDIACAGCAMQPQEGPDGSCG